MRVCVCSLDRRRWKMPNVPLRAVATGAPLACCALAMHMYTSILFEHEVPNLLYGMYIIFVYAIWPLLRRDTEMRKHHLRLATISTLLLFFTLGSAQVAFLIGEMLSPSKYAKLVFACAQSVVYFLTNFFIGSFFVSRNNRRALLFKRFSTSESSDIPPIRYLARQRTDNHISDCNGPFIRKYICWDHQHLSRILK
ncbi:hypothetical protein L208DRAFT_23641 [Tricholoma matsutake]|nr:hypothetical protein L208DRAFT_23641 [Tricholoma matsutake 945]